MPFKAAVTPKCPRCSKSAYPAESISVKIAGETLTYHNACFKCPDCGTKLNLKTYKVSDFGDHEVYCQKCVPKQAPSQSAESIDTDRTRKAAALTKDVGMVNQQMRGAEETLGKGGAGASTVITERVAKATALAKDVGMVNEQMRGASIGQGAEGHESMETARVGKAGVMNTEAGKVNEQVRGATETVGKGAQSSFN
eukprot:gene9089-28798_t